MIYRWFPLHSRPGSLIAALALVVMVGVVDYATGRDWQIAPLYILPLAIAVWGAGRRWGIFFSLLATGIWLIAELSFGAPHEQTSAPYWNALFLFSTAFLSVTLIMSALHDLVKMRTEQLRKEMMRRHEADLALLRSERLALVGTMAAQVAHEVRNPMSSISLNMELLAHEISTLAANRSHSPDEATLLLAAAGREIGRVEEVIREFLGFARLPKVVSQPLKVHRFLDEKLAFAKAELDAAGVRMVKGYDPHVDLISADPAQLWQVLLNLLRNAREAMPDGGEITLRTRRTSDAVEISVSDTGCGMTKNELTQLFTPFFTTKAQGTGLGLALSQRIVTEHGGCLEGRSAPGVGTTFTILLPHQMDGIPPHQTSTDHHEIEPSAIHELQSAGSR